MTASGGTSSVNPNPISGDEHVLLVVIVIAAIGRRGGRDGVEIPGSSDRVLGPALKVPGLISGEEAVPALAVRHVRMASHA